MVISVDTEKAFGRVHHHFMKKFQKQLRLGRDNNTMKAIDGQIMASTLLNGIKVTFPINVD